MFRVQHNVAVGQRYVCVIETLFKGENVGECQTLAPGGGESARLNYRGVGAKACIAFIATLLRSVARC